MGARISAHLANAGVPSYLFDIVPPDADGPARNRIAAAGLEAAVKSKPAAFFKPSLARLVTIGNFEDDLPKLAEVDWIIEAVVEDLDIKRELLKQRRCRPQARDDHHHQHQRPACGQDRRRLPRRLPPLLVRHALLQSAALHASAGADSHARRRSRRDADHRGLLRSAPGQRRGACQGHAELHRQPHRHLLHAERHAPDAGDGPQRRGSGRADRTPPSAGRRRRPSASATWSASTFSATWCATPPPTSRTSAAT